MKAIELTPTSWILHKKDGSKYGILVKVVSKYTLLTAHAVEKYDNLDHLQDNFGPIKFEERQKVIEKEVFVSGFPVDVNEIFEVNETSEIPSFKKTQNGKAEYAPGYWGVNFSGHYVGSFCPKLSTLKSNEHIGPFKNRFIMNDEISVANKRLGDDSPNDS